MPQTDITYVAAKDVDLKGSWDTFWNAISGDVKSVLSLIAIIGAVIIVGAIITYFWNRKRGGDASTSALMWTVAVGALLAAPGAIIPLLLLLFDAIANGMLTLLSRVVK